MSYAAPFMKGAKITPITSTSAIEAETSGLTSIRTPWSLAKQSLSSVAESAIAKVKEGAKLYRIGTTGVSAEGAEAQFWSLENPLDNPAAYSKKYGVPINNIKNANFIETAEIKEGADFITREAPAAPGSPAGSGGGVEAVVEIGGTKNNVITTIQKH